MDPHVAAPRRRSQVELWVRPLCKRMPAPTDEAVPCNAHAGAYARGRRAARGIRAARLQPYGALR